MDHLNPDFRSTLFDRFIDALKARAANRTSSHRAYTHRTRAANRAANRARNKRAAASRKRNR